MHGFPNVFSTKADYYNVLVEYTDKVKAKLREVMDGRFIWVNEKELHDGEKYFTSPTQRLLETSERNDETNEERKVFYQQTLVEDPNSEFNRLGWTNQEADTFLNWKAPEEGE